MSDPSDRIAYLKARLDEEEVLARVEDAVSTAVVARATVGDTTPRPRDGGLS